MAVPHRGPLRPTRKGGHKLDFGVGVTGVCGAPGNFKDPQMISFHSQQWAPVWLVLVLCGWCRRGSSKHSATVWSPVGPLCFSRVKLGWAGTQGVGICIELSGWRGGWTGPWAPLSSDRSLCVIDYFRSLVPQAAQCYLLRR